MRNLFLLLVLLNLGFWATVSWVLPSPPPATRYDGPGITLLREADPGAVLPPSAPAIDDDDESAAIPVPEGSQPQAAAARCIAIGPFSAAADADAAKSTLVDAGFEPTVTTTEEQVWDGYWVYIEAVENAQAARDILARLKENGIDDAYEISNSDSGILVSLGVFSDVSRAGSRAERVGQLGYKATIADRHRTAEMRWLELTLSGAESAALDLLQTPGQISRLVERDCPAIASSAD